MNKQVPFQCSLHRIDAEGMIDLMEPFRRRDIYHWRMNGYYSLKSVLPALVPEMTYDGLEISDGAMGL